MDLWLILLIVVGFAIALAVIAGGYAARLLLHAAETSRSSHERPAEER